MFRRILPSEAISAPTPLTVLFPWNGSSSTWIHLLASVWQLIYIDVLSVISSAKTRLSVLVLAKLESFRYKSVLHPVFRVD